MHPPTDSYFKAICLHFHHDTPCFIKMGALDLQSLILSQSFVHILMCCLCL